MISFILIFIFYNNNFSSNYQLPIENLDDYEEITTNIQSDYIITNYDLYNNIFYANNNQYSISNNGTITKEKDFKRPDDYSSFIYESENNVTFFICTDKYLAQSSNNYKYSYNSKNIAKKTSEKCSVTLFNESNVFYPIISGIKKTEYFLFGCEIKIYFIKLNNELQLQKYFYKPGGHYCTSSTEAEISTCVSLFNGSYILCVYKNSETLVGGIINSNFTDFEQLYYIHGDNNNFKNFFFFNFNDTGILISRLKNTNMFCVTQIQIYTDNYYLKRENVTEFESELDLNNIGVALHKEGIYISTILNKFIYLYCINLTDFSKYEIKIANSETIKQITLINFEENYFGIIFLKLTTNIYNLTYSIFSYPEKLKCTPQNFTSYSQELINIDISDIFPNYTNAFLSENPFNLVVLDKNVSGNTLDHGIYKTEISYLYNNNKNIFINDNLCYFNYQICNEACDTCYSFSDDNDTTLCIKCITNYAPLANDTSQCEKNTDNISLYYYSSEDNIFYCCFSSCLYCSKEGNELENNCDECLNENYRRSYMKKGQCILCDNLNNLFYYSSEEGTICLDISITKCPDDYPYLIKENNECISNCPPSYPILLNNECINECPSEEGFVYSSNTCICISKYLYYYDVDNNNNLVCIINKTECPNNYPIKENRECKKNENGKNIIFNGDTINECPENTEQIDKGDYYSCSCITPYYILDNIIYCSINNLCTENSNGYILLIKEENLCVKECNTNYPINFNNYCLKKCPTGYTIYNNNCIILSHLEITEDTIIEIYDLYTITKSQNYIAQTYDSSEQSTKNANSYYEHLSTIDFGECINVLKEKNHIQEDENLIILKIDIYREDSVTNQVEYSVMTKNGKKLDLSVCSGINIEIDNSVNLNSEELNLDKALEAFSYGYDIYNANDIFYNDICTIFTNNDGSDVILENRKSDYYVNISFCEDNCEYIGFNLTTLRVKCSCEIKTEVSEEKNTFSFQSLRSEFTSIISNSNIRVFTCYKNVFSNFIIKNYAFWFILVGFIGEIVCFILYYLTGFDPLFLKIQKSKDFYDLDKLIENDNLIHEYIKHRSNLYPSKSFNIKSISNNNSTSRINEPNNPPKKKQSDCIINSKDNIINNDNTEKNLNINERKTYNIPLEKKIKKQKTLKCYLEEKFNGNKEQNIVINNNNLNSSYEKIENPKLNIIKQYTKKKKKKKTYERYKTDYKLNGNRIKLYSGNKLKILKACNFDNSDKSSLNSEKTNKEKIKNENNKNHKNDEQLNYLKYKDAINDDKRTFIQIYYGFLKYSQLIIFSFITDSDYNLKYIKIVLFIFSFIGYFFFNTLFFSDETMTNIYEHKGKYQFIYSLPKTIFSSICCILINMLLKFISLSNKQISTLKKEKNPIKEEKLLLEIIRCLKIKLIIFFVLIFLFTSIFWYYVCSFCAVYINTQKHLLKDTFISFTESMVYPFAYCLIIACLRFLALKCKIKFLFIISKIFQKLFVQ